MKGTFGRGLRSLLIVSAVSACDNVDWGGARIELQPPPVKDSLALEESRESDATLSVPQGPILFVVTRPEEAAEGESSILLPVGEIRENSVVPFPSESNKPGYRAFFTREVLQPGTEYSLYAGGSRVGTFVAGDQIVTDETFCTPRPGVRGVTELLAGAGEQRRFLALRKEGPETRRVGYSQPPESNLAQRNATIEAANDIIPQVGAQWPTSMPIARRDLRILPAETGTLVASTFLFRDEMTIAPPSDGTYALFILLEEAAGGYEREYVWYREARRDGKGIPRIIDHLDWDGDGEPEVLLDMLGAESRWFAALGRSGGEWTRAYQDPCGAPEVQAPAPPAG